MLSIRFYKVTLLKCGIGGWLEIVEVIGSLGSSTTRHSFLQANKIVYTIAKGGVRIRLASCNLKNIFVAPSAFISPVSNWVKIMPRRSFFGCCCVYQKCPVKDDLIKLRSKEECSVKDDLLEAKSNVENDLLEFTSEELSRFTNQFSPENLIGVADLGKLYRGKMPIASDQGKVYKDVTVKILVEDERSFRMIMPASVQVKVLVDDKRGILIHDSKLSRLEDELKFLQAPKIRGNPSLMKVVGYCRKEIVGVVYDINPLDTLHNLIFQDDFNWLQRIKTALALARLLAYLHDRNQPYLIRNLAPSHIVVDKNFTPVLFEFGMLVGGVLGTTVEESDMRIGPCGYIDPFYSYNGPVAYTVKFDVYAFGVLLFNLTSKRAFDKEKYTGTAIQNWAVNEYKSRHSYVDLSLEDNADFDRRDGRKITELTRQCMDGKPNKRPEMKEVFERLKGLRCSVAAAW